MNRKRPEDLRSHRWLGVNDLRSFGHRSRLRQFGYDAADWAGRPVIGIINTWSEINAELDKALRPVWEGERSPREAVQAIKPTIDQLLERGWRDVKS